MIDNGVVIKVERRRSSNIELYRILVMLLIVAHHYVVNSGLMEVMNENILSQNTTFFSLFGAWGKTGINCFVLITGYFMCMSQITLRKFLRLFLWVITYTVLFLVVFLLCNYKPFGILSMVYEAIPLKNLTTGFTSCFIVFYLCIPFLNILLNNITKRQHQWYFFYFYLFIFFMVQYLN